MNRSRGKVDRSHGKDTRLTDTSGRSLVLSSCTLTDTSSTRQPWERLHRKMFNRSRGQMFNRSRGKEWLSWLWLKVSAKPPEILSGISFNLMRIFWRGTWQGWSRSAESRIVEFSYSGKVLNGSVGNFPGRSGKKPFASSEFRSRMVLIEVNSARAVFFLARSRLGS